MCLLLYNLFLQSMNVYIHPRIHVYMGRCTCFHMCVCVCVHLFSPQMQYSFIYQALLEYYLYGDTELDVSSLEGHLHKLHNTSAPSDRVGLEEEFKVRPLAVHLILTNDRSPPIKYQACSTPYQILTAAGDVSRVNTAPL